MRLTISDLLLLAIGCMLLAIGCATARTEPRPTTLAEPAPAEQLEEPEAAEATRLAAELETSLANPPAAVPEPTPPEPLWAGYMVVQTGSVPPAVAILFPEDGIITRDVLADGIQLNAATASADGGYWLFPVTRGALLFKAVRVYDDGHVVVEAPVRTNHGDAMIIAAAYVLDDPSGTTMYTPCAHSVCGRLQKAVANRIVSCEGPGCADLMAPTP